MFDSVCHGSFRISVSPHSFRVSEDRCCRKCNPTTQCLSYRGVEKFPPPLVTLQGKWVWCCCPKLVQFSPLKFTHSNRTPVRPPPCPVCKAAKLMHKYQFCSFHSRKQGAYSHFEEPDSFSSLALSEPIPKT